MTLPEIRQFPGVVGGGRVMIPLRYEDGWDVLTDDGLSFFTPASAREMADDLERDMAEAAAAGHDWGEPHIVATYRMLADLMDQIVGEAS